MYYVCVCLLALRGRGGAPMRDAKNIRSSLYIYIYIYFISLSLSLCIIYDMRADEGREELRGGAAGGHEGRSGDLVGRFD